MPTKTILLYDSSNHVLRERGIRIELFDASSGLYIAGADSNNLDASQPDQLSIEWGVTLTFTKGSNPLDIMISDPNYRYPGNMVRSLNGELQDIVYIDLYSLPTHVGGQAAPLASGDTATVIGWIEQGPNWNVADKDAIYTLLFNYLRMVTARPDTVRQSPELQRTAENWARALRRLGIDPDLFQPTPRGSAPPIAGLGENIFGGLEQLGSWKWEPVREPRVPDESIG